MDKVDLKKLNKLLVKLSDAIATDNMPQPMSDRCQKDVQSWIENLRDEVSYQIEIIETNE